MKNRFIKIVATSKSYSCTEIVAEDKCESRLKQILNMYKRIEERHKREYDDKLTVTTVIINPELPLKAESLNRHK